jgi:hypothetical protein
MNKTWFRLAFLALFSLAFAACRTGAVGGGAITVRATQLRAGSSGPAGETATLTLSFANENIFALGYTRSTHKLYLDGAYAGEAEMKKPFGIPATNAVSHDVTLTVENPARLRQLATGPGASAVAYRLESVFYQTVYNDDHVIKCDSAGTLDLSRFSAGK